MNPNFAPTWEEPCPKCGVVRWTNQDANGPCDCTATRATADSEATGTPGSRKATDKSNLGPDWHIGMGGNPKGQGEPNKIAGWPIKVTLEKYGCDGMDDEYDCIVVSVGGVAVIENTIADDPEAERQEMEDAVNTIVGAAVVAANLSDTPKGQWQPIESLPMGEVVVVVNAEHHFGSVLHFTDKDRTDSWTHWAKFPADPDTPDLSGGAVLAEVDESLQGGYVGLKVVNKGRNMVAAEPLRSATEFGSSDQPSTADGGVAQ